MNGILNIPISEEDASLLYQHWADQAFSSLMAAIATERLSRISANEQKRHYNCAKKATNLQSHAKCVSDLLTISDEEAKRFRWLKHVNEKRLKNHMLQNESLLNAPKLSVKLKRNSQRKSFWKGGKRKLLWKGGFRVSRHKRDVFSSSNYNITEENDGWQEVISEIKQHAEEQRIRHRAKKLIEERLIHYSKAAVELKKRGRSQDLKLPELYELEKLLKAGNEPEDMKQFIQTNKSMTNTEQAVMKAVEFIRKGVKLAMKISGENATDFDNRSLRMISPRFMSLVPENVNGSSNEVNLLSPSLLSLHNDGKGIEQMTSLPSLLGLSGLQNVRDQQDWMDFIIEASGASDAIEKVKIEKEQKEKANIRHIRGPDGQPIYLNKDNVTKIYGRHEASKIEVFEKLQNSFSQHQLRDMNRTGYTILSPEQIELVYGATSPFNNSETLAIFNNITDDVVHRAIHYAIRDIADGRLQFHVRNGTITLSNRSSTVRQKRQIVLSPIVGTIIANNAKLASQPIILSPILFSAVIGSPAIFGAVVLSPWLFLPVILSPRILSPVVLTPIAFAPIILSPLALTPIILSPGIMNPFVLSPLLLNPFILSPQVMTPLILSPFALSPFIGIPSLLSPIVLSPFVLSPLILSPSYVSALVLSPHALSPAVESTGAIFTAIASPSWLS
ncbi:hypothetical protein DICVIV_06911 [Dictyocaulus viviparus]|uniref:Uncharacterized protein n=1 Tax=Dictyocaulus viviparus TaxID=29172 RepID=A0A0D8XTD2_DICVI|nr:hypothetical protein DICVIV_06911 [Dictyocaulus viviparus]